MHYILKDNPYGEGQSPETIYVKRVKIKAMKVERNNTKVVVWPVTLCYVHLLQKYVPEGAGEESAKYSCTILIPKTETAAMAEIRAAIEQATNEAVPNKWRGKRPLAVNDPISDGDAKDDEEFHGNWLINAKSGTRPGVVDRDLLPITDEEEVYSGMVAAVSVNFYGYSASGNNGIAAGLNNVRKIKDGPRYGGRASAQHDFRNVSIDDDDEFEL